ncbi:MAG: hypothetical protein D6687_00425 [Acidobacteria bacterium]|jgi:hypothetical protein|nr:MAG: hypothetical protein D6687_00425 [Acidobacteriota bacterium]GIU81062.1 MAG: hypothetical protein KatS3mg006_0126 [Pyrinomonadaceae bacterium]
MLRKRFLYALFATSFFACFSFGQRPMPIPEESPKEKQIKPAPDSFPAKYEGGMLGYSKKLEGTLKFDTPNKRLVFFNKANKELFWIPYDSIKLAYPHSRSVVSNAGRAISVVPYFGVLGSFIREERRYMVIHFDDQEIGVSGATSFKIEDQDLLDSALLRLAKEADLKQRGDAYYRPKEEKQGTSQDKQMSKQNMQEFNQNY